MPSTRWSRWCAAPISSGGSLACRQPTSWPPTPKARSSAEAGGGSFGSRLMRSRGLEPPRLAALTPQASASTNSATTARGRGIGRTSSKLDGREQATPDRGLASPLQTPPTTDRLADPNPPDGRPTEWAGKAVAAGFLSAFFAPLAWGRWLPWSQASHGGGPHEEAHPTRPALGPMPR